MNSRRGHFNNSCFYYNPTTQTTNLKRTSKEDLYFQSKYEFQVYRAILKVVKRQYLTLQYPLEIKPKTPIFPAISWKIDFAIQPIADLPANVNRSELFPQLFIESKGLPTREFKRDIQYLQWQQPRAYASLILVSETKLDYPDVPCVKLSQLIAFLQERLRQTAHFRLH